MSTVIYRVAARLIVPLSLLFAMFIYFKGHQEPGGGFVAGLVCAVALIVHRMAYGGDSLHRLLPAQERTFVAVGLMCALVTGSAALVFGPPNAYGIAMPLPFFTSNHGFIPLPGEEHVAFEWATVMLFDFGVMLVVTGVVVGMIEALSRELE
jgi:multisubunit Na+/H+ antiporter MnhB subunit